MCFKSKLIDNFSKILDNLNVSNGRVGSDVICSISLNTLSSILKLQNITRGDIINLSNAWVKLPKNLPTNLHNNVYEKIMTTGCINENKMGYNNLYLEFTNSMNVFKPDECNFIIICNIGGFMGKPNNMYSKRIFGALINAEEYDAYFETKDDLIDFLNNLEFKCVSISKHRCVIKAKISLQMLRVIDPSAKMVDFDALKDALKSSYLEVIDNTELLDIVEFNITESESKNGTLEEFDVTYEIKENEKFLVVEVIKEFS